jgi:hypothetical protein
MATPTPAAVDAAAHGVYTTNRETMISQNGLTEADIPTWDALDDASRDAYRAMEATAIGAAYKQLTADILNDAATTAPAVVKTWILARAVAALA